MAPKKQEFLGNERDFASIAGRGEREPPQNNEMLGNTIGTIEIGDYAFHDMSDYAEINRPIGCPKLVLSSKSFVVVHSVLVVKV